MAALFFKLFDWIADSKWAQYGLLAAVGAVALKLFFWRHDNKIRKQERQVFKQKQAEVRTETIERTNSIIQEEQTYADRALEARDSGESYSDFDSLPDDLKAIARGRPGPR